MKKLLLTAMAVVCIAGSLVTAQDAVTQDEWNEIMNEWIMFNGRENKEAINGILDEIETKIREEFPMDPQLKQDLEALTTEKYNALSAKASEFGYSNYKEAIRAHVAVDELMQIESSYDDQLNSLTNDYYEEFWGRYRATCAETLQRLMENAEEMK